jgi:hypothetical protein
MSKSQSTVPAVPRSKAPAPVKLTFPSRYNHRFPDPDDEPFDSVNQLEFGLQFFAFVIGVFILTAGFAAFVLVPAVGSLLSH